MYLPNQKAKVSNYKGSEVFIDWKYLLKDHGLKRELESFEKSLAKFLLLLAVFGFLFLGFYAVSTSINIINLLNPSSVFDLLFWIFVLVFLYSFFLHRNRELFVDSLRIKDLHALKQKLNAKNVLEINLTDYIDHDLLNILDDILLEDKNDFLTLLSKQILSYKNVLEVNKRLGISINQLQKVFFEYNRLINTHTDIWLSKSLVRSFEIALELDQKQIDEISMFIYLVSDPLKEILKKENVLPEEVDALGMWIKNQNQIKYYQDLFKTKKSLKPVSTVNRALTSRFSPTLIKFQRDFTAEIVKGNFTFSIAREKELNNLTSFLEEGKKSAVIITGSPGVGKTTLLKSLAVKMVVEDVPDVLKDKRLVGFDFNRAFALSKNLDDFKNKVENILEETASTKNIVLVLDDFDQVLAIRKDASSEVVNLLLNSYEKFDLRIIATSSKGGYNKFIKSEKSLSALFKEVELTEPNKQLSVQVLMDKLPVLELENKVKVGFGALVKLVELSDSFSFEKAMPDKGIDLLEEVMISAKNQGLDFADEYFIEDLISKKVGVKLGALSKQESKKLTELESELHKMVVGQNYAVESVANAIRRSRAGLNEGNKPIASFLFFGPTGVGKTQLAKALTRVYYGDKKLLHRFDMSEYNQPDSVEKLLGKYENNEFVGGYLSEAIRSKPYSLVLLDEIEKAHIKVLDLFLQVLDEGTINDGMGRKLSFVNTIIIATSNVGANLIAEQIAKRKSYTEIQKVIIPRLRKYLRLEFINRFDKVILFKPLVPIEVQEIAKILMDEEVTKLNEQGIDITYDNNLIIELAKIAYSPMFGARQLKRVIQEQIEDNLAKMIILGKIKAGESFHISSLEGLKV